MRFFEFGGPEGVGVDKFVMALRNYVGRAASKKSSSKLNWAAIERMTNANGFEFAADYETFKSMYDSSPAIQGLVKNFNDDGIELNVPGAPDADKEPTQGTGQTSQQAVDKIAASAAPQQLSTQA